MNEKQVSLSDFLLPKELDRVKALWSSHKDDGKFVHRVCEDIIRPNIDRIDEALGQKNDPMYLAYMVEYIARAST